MDDDKELTFSEWKQSFEHLTNSPAWHRITKAIQGQVDNLQNDILFQPLVEQGDILRCERKKGSLEGRLSLVSTAAGILSEIEHELVLKQSKENKDVD